MKYLCVVSRERDDSTPPLPDSEYDELMNRNKTIASSAISKAVAGAAAGLCQSSAHILHTVKY